MASFKATWDAVPSTDIYKVEWFKNGVSLGTPASAFTPTHMKEIATVPGDVVKAQITATNEDGPSPVTSTNEVTALPQPPAAPTNALLVQL